MYEFLPCTRLFLIISVFPVCLSSSSSSPPYKTKLLTKFSTWPRSSRYSLAVISLAAPCSELSWLRHPSSGHLVRPGQQERRADLPRRPLGVHHLRGRHPLQTRCQCGHAPRGMQAVPAGAGAGQYGTGGVSVHLAADAAPGAGTSSNVPESYLVYWVFVGHV